MKRDGEAEGSGPAGALEAIDVQVSGQARGNAARGIHRQTTARPRHGLVVGKIDGGAASDTWRRPP